MQPHRGFFSGSTKTELHFLAPEGWHRVAIDQGGFLLWMIDHLLDANHGAKSPESTVIRILTTNDARLPGRAEQWA